MSDIQRRFHEEWLGLAQPIEGLVFSIPVLADAQIMPQAGPELSARFRSALVHPSDGAAPGHLGDLRAFFQNFLGYHKPGMLVPRAELPESLDFYAQEGRQDIRPSFAIARGPFESATSELFADLAPAPGADAAPTAATAASAATPSASPYLALVWDLRDDAGEQALDLSLDKPEDATGPWRYPPTAKLERLLRHTGIPIGLLCNGRDLRLLYAPAGETTSHLTFRTADLQTPPGRPLLAAFDLLLGAERTYRAAEAFTLEGLLRESRRRQADVTKDLAAQVFEAVELLLEGFEHAAARDARVLASDGALQPDWLRAALEQDGDHLYQGVLSVVLRLVFLLYSEDQGLVPTAHPLYARHLSVQGLYDALLEDAGMHPESMHHRFGAYGRLLALFRAVFLGATHDDLHLPPRRGKLFDPSTFPFIEGGLPGSTAAITLPEARAAVRPPSLDDGTIHAVLHRLIVFEGQRLSYRALDVEQLGSVYESLMGYHVLRVESPAVRLGSARVWVETSALRERKPAERAKYLKDTCDLPAATLTKIEAALATHSEDDALADALADLAPGKTRDRARHRVPAGRLVLQPGEERRRSGSHYTPRALTERIVRRTLEPLLKCLGDAPTESQLLALKLCDPAMGSGAFLVEVTRQLADHLVAAWTRAGLHAQLAEQHGDPHLHARRLVAQRCVYGVDKNPAAVELAKLSLWLITLSKELPFTFVDHALRHGDSLVGLDLDQVSSFDWKRGPQLPLFTELMKDALDQALEHRSELLALADREDTQSQEEKRRLLDHADHATARIRLIADLCVGAFFAEQKDKDRERERDRRKLLVERWLAGDETLDPELHALAATIRHQHAPFHWWLEFPEIFYAERPDPLSHDEINGAAYMEAFVGNPPFAGKNGITATSGEGYLDWLQTVHEGAHGNADLSAHFFRRCATLIGDNGAMGLIATNTIGQGDTRQTGLQHLTENGHRIYAARPNMPWPGAAAVTVSVVHLAKGTPATDLQPTLDDQPVPTLSSQLRPTAERSDPVKLQANAGFSYQGSIVLGMGFTLTPDERDALIAKNPKNAERIFPYLGGEEVNTSPTQGHDRYVISFGQMELAEAEQWPDLLAIVREKVKPERERQKDLGGKKLWWLHLRPRPELFDALTPLKRCLVTSAISKHRCFAFQPTDRIWTHNVYVFAIEHWTFFAVIQSRAHATWVALTASGLEDRGGYRPSDCFDTFPFPSPDPRTVLPSLEAAGQALYEARVRFMLDADQGLTKTYNALKDPKTEDPRIQTLRHLHESLDQAVLEAYGWPDLPVPPYCPKTDADRTALQAFEDAIIDRLYALNAERAREEQRLGLGAKKKAGKATAGKKKPAKRKSGRQPVTHDAQTSLAIEDADAD